VKHPRNTFILQKSLGPCAVKLYEGKDILRLKNREPCAPVAETWPEIQEYLSRVK